MPVDVKSLNGLSNKDDNVSLTDGKINLSLTDIKIPSPNLSLTVKRQYNEPQEESGPMGRWRFGYNQYIQMYEDFKIVEYRGDGSARLYNFTKNNPDEMVDSYDGDSLIYYNLDDGYYTPDSNDARMKIGQPK